MASWNVAFGGALRAQREGELLRGLGPDLIFLQEVNPGSAEALRQSAGAGWLVTAVSLRAPAASDRSARRRGVAIAGCGAPPARYWLLEGVVLPERVLVAEISVAGVPVTVISYHAPPGVSWGLVKPRQAVALASWLATHHGPVLLGADANTPLLDAADFAHTHTHWHTGNRRLHGEPGDDLMFGPAKIHPWTTCSAAGWPASLAEPPRQSTPHSGRWRSPTAPANARTSGNRAALRRHLGHPALGRAERLPPV